MSVKIIDTLKPKNSGTFPVVEAVDVAVAADLRLPEALEAKADASALADTNAAVSAKANASDVATETASLQAQIDAIVTPVTQDAEVQNARVDVYGQTHTTLKDRIDSSDSGLTEFKVKIADAITLNYEIGYFIMSNSTKASNANFMISEPFFVNKGCEIVVRAKGYETSVAIIAQTNSEGTIYTKVVQSLDSNFRYYTYTVPADGYYMISAHKNFTPEVYIKSIENDISKINNKITDIDQNFFGQQTLSFTNGSYISSSGSKETNPRFQVSSAITLTKGDRIKIKAHGYLTNVAILAETDAEQTTYTPKVVSTDSTYKFYDYIVENTGLYVISNSIVDAAELYILSNDDELTSRVTTLESEISLLVENEFTPISSVGTLLEGKSAQSNGAGLAYMVEGDSTYNVREYVVPAGVKAIRVYCTATSDTRFGVGFFCLQENNIIIYQYNSETPMAATVDIEIPEGTYKIWANGQFNLVPTIQTCTVQKVSNSYTKSEIDAKIEYIDPFSDISLFSKFGVIGDSYASGVLIYGNVSSEKYDISWGQILARKHGITCTNYSAGGLSTRTWLTSPRGLALLNSSADEDLYLLALGINDYYNLGVDYLGDITDITDYSDPSEYGDTFYGNYGRIVEAVKSHAPNAKIIMFTVANQDTVPAMFSDAIIEIAEHYNIPYIVQYSDDFFKSQTYTDMNGGHPTAIGYSGMACAFDRLINKCMVDFHTYFRNTFMY